MATQMTLLQGEVETATRQEPRNVERLLAGFLRALLAEQKQGETLSPIDPTPATRAHMQAWSSRKEGEA